MIDFSRNHFELFDLPVRYRVDAVTLERAYRDLQGAVHPDRHAGAQDAQKRLALQASARVNEAYRTLKDPVARAQYLLQLRGVDTAAETDNRLPVEFLTRQLERREEAEAAAGNRDDAALARLVDDVRADAAALQGEVERLLDGDDLDAASSQVREMLFLVKLGTDLDEMHAAELER
jgi:molecular chaperone HscB